MKRRVIANLWKGDIGNVPSYSADMYGIQYVEKLARGIRRHVTDGALTMLMDQHYATLWGQHAREMDDDLDVTVRPYEGYDCGGWSRRFENMRPGLHPTGERVVMMDLDTILVGNCDWLWSWDESPVGLHLDPYYDPKVGCGIVTFDGEGAAIVWDAFLKARENGMADYYAYGHPSEMILLRALYVAHGWKPLEPKAEKLLSYKVHVMRQKREIKPERLASVREPNPWDRASIVYFHGHPRPNELAPQHALRQEWDRP